MSDVTIPYRFLLRGGTAANLAAVNEVPRAREMVVETDTRKLKVGDGVTAYNLLPYIQGALLGGIESVEAGTGIIVDVTDPANPIVSLSEPVLVSLGRAETAVQEVRAGANVEVDVTDPRRPIVSAVEADNPFYPQLTDQAGDGLTDQAGRPLRQNTPGVPRLWLLGLGPMPAYALADALALEDVPDGATILINGLAGGREPCWYDASTTTWRRFSDRTDAD